MTGTGMNPDPIQGAQIKVASASSAKDKAHLPLIAHAIEETKAMHVLWGRMALALATFSNSRLVQLAVIPPGQLDQVPCPIRGSTRMATDAAGIDQVRLC